MKGCLPLISARAMSGSLVSLVNGPFEGIAYIDMEIDICYFVRCLFDSRRLINLSLFDEKHTHELQLAFQSVKV